MAQGVVTVMVPLVKVLIGILAAFGSERELSMSTTGGNERNR